jgi:hypothetical protein
MGRTVLVCLALGALSLLGPSEPSYDPWAWLVWGREIGHLTLDTTGGPSWKPLPVALTTLFAPLSAVDDRLPPALWMAVARAGGLLAVVLAFRLAGRLAGGASARRLIAGGVAAVALVLTPDWIKYFFHGNEAPLTMALALWAVERHLDGHERSAVVLGGLVCLSRPELFGFLLLYCAWVWWRRRGRLVAAAVLAVVPLAWLVPSWWGSGDPFYAGAQARSEPSWSLSLAPVPWRAALDVAQSQAWVVLEVAALAAVVLAVASWRRARGRLPRPGDPMAVIVLAAFAAVLVGLYAAMTQAGFSGNVRYVLPALVVLTVLGGASAGLLVDLGASTVSRAWRARPATAAAFGGAVAGLLLLAGAAPELPAHVREARSQASDGVERSQLHVDLERAVDLVGARYITMFGPPTVNRSYQTHLAWELGLPLSDIHGSRGRGILFRAPAEPVAGVARIYRKVRRRVLVARVGDWRITARPPDAPHIFKWPIAGFRLRTAAARYRQDEGSKTG